MSYWGYTPYVPVAARKKKAEMAAARAKKAGAQLSPIAAYRGAIAKTFWGKAWCDNLERYSDFANRLPRGRTYVRSGAVIDLVVAAGEVRAQVMGSSLYKVSVTVSAVPEKHWKAIGADCSGSIDTLVELLQGKLSKAVMERICRPGIGLFPAPKEIRFECSCPDAAQMCKHVAAVLYGVGVRLDQQPEFLFGLRKVDVKDLVSHAGAGLPVSATRPASGRMLDDALLGDVFGIEMADAAPPTKQGKVSTSTPPRPPATAKPSASRPASKTAKSVVARAKSKPAVKAAKALAVRRTAVRPPDSKPSSKRP